MAWTQEQLDAIEAAIADGSLEVEYRDRRVKYRSLDEMFKIRNMIRDALGITEGRTTRILGEFSRGHNSEDDENC